MMAFLRNADVANTQTIFFCQGLWLRIINILFYVSFFKCYIEKSKWDIQYQIHTLLPGTFAGNIRIRKLWLNNNPLKSLSDYNFPSIPHLRLLDLSNCHLRLLTVTSFKHLKFLELLSLKEEYLSWLEESFCKSAQNILSKSNEKKTRLKWHIDAFSKRSFILIVS